MLRTNESRILDSKKKQEQQLNGLLQKLVKLINAKRNYVKQKYGSFVRVDCNNFVRDNGDTVFLPEAQHTSPSKIGIYSNETTLDLTIHGNRAKAISILTALVRSLEFQPNQKHKKRGKHQKGYTTSSAIKKAS